MPDKTDLDTRQFEDVAVAAIKSSSLLDTISIHHLGESLFELVEKRNAKRIVLDFSSVKFLASSGLGMLLNLRKKVSAAGGVVVICGLRPELLKVFTITNLDRLFEFFDTQEQALAHFGVAPQQM
ncbi:MAG: STAS domain-containing protein [Phycisphaerae bacterium]|nr:STAS domain-containing protein [Phycisphaerae bacterium]